MRIILLFFYLSISLFGQQIDYNTQVKNKPMTSGSSLPGTCVLGTIFFDTTAVAGENLYLCAATDVWTQMTGVAATESTSDLAAPCTKGTWHINTATPSLWYCIATDTPYRIQTSSGTGAGSIEFGTSGTMSVGAADSVKVGATTGDILAVSRDGAALEYPLLANTSGPVIRPIGCAVGDPAGSALSTGVLCYVVAPNACTITSWDILVDTGTATAGIWKIATGTAIPTVSNSIVASAAPAISSGTAIHSTSMSGWTTSVAQFDIFGFNLTTTSGPKYIYVGVNCAQ